MQDLARDLLALLTELITLVGKVEDTIHGELLRELKTSAATDLVKGGIYEKTVHFDETSGFYRDTLKAYRREE